MAITGPFPLPSRVFDLDTLNTSLSAATFEADRSEAAAVAAEAAAATAATDAAAGADALIATRMAEIDTSVTEASNSATDAQTAASLASTYADAAETFASGAAVTAGFYDTIALGRAAVADGATFGVVAGGSDGLARATTYRRDSSTTQTLITDIVSGADVTRLTYDQFAPNYIYADADPLVIPGETQIGSQTGADFGGVPRALGKIFAVHVVDLNGRDPGTTFWRHRIQFQIDSTGGYAPFNFVLYRAAGGLHVYKCEVDASTFGAIRRLDYQVGTNAGDAIVRQAIYISEDGLPNIAHLLIDKGDRDTRSALWQEMAKSAHRSAQNLLTATDGASGTAATVLSTPHTDDLSAISAIMRLSVVGGEYPEVSANGGAAGTVNLKVELFNGPSLMASLRPVRLGDSDLWFIDNAAVAGLAHTSIVIKCELPTGATSYQLHGVIVVDGGFPWPEAVAGSGGDGLTEAEVETIAATKAAEAVAGIARPVPTDALAALSVLRDRPGAVIFAGDSNTEHQGSGYRRGFEAALADRFGVIAAGQDYLSGFENSVMTGAPAELADLGTWRGYKYLPDGSAASANSYSGFLTRMDDAASSRRIDTSSSLRLHFAYGTFPTGAGSFKPAARQDGGAYAIYGSSPVINTNTGSYGLATGYFDLPASESRVGGVNWRWNHFGVAGITGPFIGYWSYVEDLDKQTGVIFGVDYAGSGQSTYDLAATLASRVDEKRAREYDLYRQLQISRGFDPLVIIFICMGLNDRNETATSLGPLASTDGDGAPAFKDNTYAVIQNIKTLWASQGWDTNELRFVVMPSHPTGTPDDAELVAYRAAAKELEVMPHVRAVDMTAYPMLISFEEINGAPEPPLTSGGGYYNGEREHIAYPWNRTIIERLLDRLT